MSSQLNVAKESMLTLDNYIYTLIHSPRWECMPCDLTFTGGIRAQTVLFGSQDLPVLCTVENAPCCWYHACLLTWKVVTMEASVRLSRCPSVFWSFCYCCHSKGPAPFRVAPPLSFSCGSDNAALSIS